MKCGIDIAYVEDWIAGCQGTADPVARMAELEATLRETTDRCKAKLARRATTNFIFAFGETVLEKTEINTGPNSIVNSQSTLIESEQEIRIQIEKNISD